MNLRIGTLATFGIVLVTLAVGLTQPTQAADVEDTGVFHAASQPVTDVAGPIDAIVSPTSAAPAFALTGGDLRVEAEPGALEDPIEGTPDKVDVELHPSFAIQPIKTVTLDVGDLESSELWAGPYEREVVPLTGTVPSNLDAGLYDVVVPSLDDRARRSLSVHESWPEEPELVLLADTQTGDPRALQDGFAESTGVDPLAPDEADPRVPPDPGPFNESLARTLGVDVVQLEVDPSERWGAYRAAIERINTEFQPDLVLFSGDLTFGQSAPGSYHAEYAEAWALLNGGEGLDGTEYEGIQAPTLLSPGNHDGYVQSGEDGFAFWEAYFGPPAFARSFHNITLTSINTYDWSELDRAGASYAVSSWGGQIREDQLHWLRDTLCEANGGTPTEDEQAIAGSGCEGAGDDRVVTFSHHSPSWVQDPWKDAYEGAYRDCSCEGVPVLEQFARGFISYTSTGQAWSGEGRLELRETLREFDVDLHAAGHTHRDRVARDTGDGTIVETPQAPDSQPSLYSVTPDGQATEIPFAEGREKIENGTGPLYLETTTTASDTDEYFGLRNLTWHEGPGDFPANALGVPPFETGFPMTDPLLDELAREPSHWNADHAELGLFSTPTYLSEG